MPAALSFNHTDLGSTAGKSAVCMGITMERSKQYGFIDYFKMFAAILIIAIHTSPLLSFNQTADFIFTRIICRTAVPFFFMVTGFFVLPRCLEDNKSGWKRLSGFLAKTGSLYGAAILLYLPVNLYSGYFTESGLTSKLVKDILFNGTFYHLWYLPAVMLGAIIAYLLLRYQKTAFAAGIALILYMIGLFGDSYYGIIKGIPVISHIYQGLFHLFDYTRNGIFFAPLFLVLGYCLAEGRLPARILRSERHPAQSMSAALTGFILSFLMVLAEGMLLRNFSLQRHDSMYLFLPVAMLFLFYLLVSIPFQGNKELRRTSMLVYILHPLFIILVRGAAKVTGLTGLLVDNSLVHYIAVTVSTVLFSYIAACMYSSYKRKRTCGKEVSSDEGRSSMD